MKLSMPTVSPTKEHPQNQTIWNGGNPIGRQMDRSPVQSSFGSLRLAKVITGGSLAVRHARPDSKEEEEEEEEAEAEAEEEVNGREGMEILFCLSF